MFYGGRNVGAEPLESFYSMSGSQNVSNSSPMRLVDQETIIVLIIYVVENRRIMVINFRKSIMIGLNILMH